MNMRLLARVCLFVALALTAAVNNAGAVPIPILDPGFDIFQAGTTTLVPDLRIINVATPGAGSGPLMGVPLLNLNTFAAAGTGDIPAGWTAIGQRPAGSNNTGRSRADAGFLSPTGTVVTINSFGADPYEDPNNPGEFISTPGIFFQTLPGVSVQTNTLYTATVEVSDFNIIGLGPFAPESDNFIIGARDRIILSLSAIDTSGESPVITPLTGTLEFTDITPGGAFIFDENDPVFPFKQNSGGKSLLTLTVLTGSDVPAGDLTISFTAAGTSDDINSLGAGATAQTVFDNVTLDATPFNAGVPGDYNDNGIVDAADYTVWRDNLGGSSLTNEGAGISPGVVNQDDYDFWSSRFGEDSGSGAGLGSAAVPEPSGMIAMLVSGLLVLGWMRTANGREEATVSA